MDANAYQIVLITKERNSKGHMKLNSLRKQLTVQAAPRLTVLTKTPPYGVGATYATQFSKVEQS